MSPDAAIREYLAARAELDRCKDAMVGRDRPRTSLEVERYVRLEERLTDAERIEQAALNQLRAAVNLARAA